MDEADELNEVLRRTHPAAYRCLSPLGLRAAFPRGIPFQADEARHAKINATIGQITDGSGHPMPVPALSDATNLDPAAAFLYAPVDGPRPLRELWGARQRRLAGSPDTAISLPFVTHGLTHSLSLVSDLFADPDTDVLVPRPAWENYELLFEMHAGARVIRYRLFADGRFDEGDLEQALRSVRSKAILVLNFPSNPTGWTPSPAEAARLCAVVHAHPGPMVVVTDDAYQGWVYEPGLHPRSLFWDLAAGADPDRLVVAKADGATKELVFFSSRVAFLTHTATGAAEPVMASKLKYLVRGSVGPASGPALALSERALRDPTLEHAIDERRELIGARYRTLRSALGALDPERFRILPFNSAFFVFMELDGLDAEELRRSLLERWSVGTIAFPAENAIRLAYCSIHNDRLPELVDAIVRASA
ncbi:MAG: aminotransferase class I/II-fold pyridoxal phosphate-dependent enzyme [Myxococcota bacterium]